MCTDTLSQLNFSFADSQRLTQLHESYSLSTDLIEYASQELKQLAEAEASPGFVSDARHEAEIERAFKVLGRHTWYRYQTDAQIQVLDAKRKKLNGG